MIVMQAELRPSVTRTIGKHGLVLGVDAEMQGGVDALHFANKKCGRRVRPTWYAPARL